jgi:hypothetical protein
MTMNTQKMVALDSFSLTLIIHNLVRNEPMEVQNAILTS